jgi:hypothetical protein
VLIEAGAASVRVATIARAQRQYPNHTPGPVPDRAETGAASSPQTVH